MEKRIRCLNYTSSLITGKMPPSALQLLRRQSARDTHPKKYVFARGNLVLVCRQTFYTYHVTKKTLCPDRWFKAARTRLGSSKIEAVPDVGSPTVAA